MRALNIMWKSKRIWFFCPACDEKLVIDHSFAGTRVDCPECGRHVPVPMKSNAMPASVKRAGIYAVQVLVVLAVAGVVWWRIDGEQAPATRATGTALLVATNTANEADQAVAGDAAPRDVNQQLLADHAKLKDRYDTMLQWMMDNYRGKYPLPERLVDKVKIVPLEDNGEVSPDLIELLKLNSEEVSQVKDVINYVRANLEQAERERARITEQTDDRITYEVPIYPEVGQPLKEDLYLTLESTLGAPRFDRMVDMAGPALREQLNYYGEASRTLTFEVIQPSVPGAHPPYMIIRNGWMFPEGDSVRMTVVKETAVMTLPESYRAYADWLPDSMAGFAVQ